MAGCAAKFTAAASIAFEEASMLRNFLTLCTFGLMSLNVSALPPVIDGIVFEDKNANGVMDKDELGIADLAVSDGIDITKTDANGYWKLYPSQSTIVFVIKPDGWQVPMTSAGLPDFWIDVHSEKANRGIRFALQKKSTASVSQPLNLLIFGDPQPKNSQDVVYYEKDIVEPLIGKTKASLGISLGDIVHSNLSLYPSMNNVTARLQTPWLHVSGNHDRDYEAGNDEQSLSTFSQYFGPDTFAWEQDGVSVVVLDNVIHEPNSGTPARYVGGFRESQFEFLSRYLNGLKKNRRIILAMHIPVFDADAKPERDTFRNADRQRLFALLAGFDNVLILSSHSHTQRHFFHGAKNGWQGKAPLHEYNVGAACGSFWSGIKDSSGVPDATMQDGTPNGYARVAWNADAAPKLSWHVARAAANKQMQLFAPKVLRHKAYPGFSLYANVFMGMPETPVEYRIDNREWKPMLRVEAMDPNVLEKNFIDARATTLRSYDLMPEALLSNHLWKIALPTDLSPGKHLVEVRAKLGDQWFSETLSYSLQQAKP
jgi:C terminal of Calcineurin-like phosphoesterase/N terminal of Calcineurin-like phosphoesterase/Calcineurin-like phosphoesterase